MNELVQCIHTPHWSTICGVSAQLPRPSTSTEWNGYSTLLLSCFRCVLIEERHARNTYLHRARRIFRVHCSSARRHWPASPPYRNHQPFRCVAVKCTCGSFQGRAGCTDYRLTQLSSAYITSKQWQHVEEAEDETMAVVLLQTLHLTQRLSESTTRCSVFALFHVLSLTLFLQAG